jgi:tetratricopeptide (TPR) repeat protein
VCALVLVAAGCWTYSTSFAGVFLGDDSEAIVDNPHIKTLWPLGTAMSASPDSGLAGRPVTSLTLALNYALAPPEARDVFKAGVQAPLGDPADPVYGNVWGYHALNLGVHLAAALLLFGVVRRTLVSPPLLARFGRASTPLSFAVSLLWLIHPLQTESVTYVVQRLESLMGLFYLLTLYCAIRAVEVGPASQRRWWIGASIAACVLGMGSKEVMVGAPIIVALWIWICRPDQRLLSPAVRPLVAGLAATWIVLAALVASNPRSQSVGVGLGGWMWWSYLQTQAAVVVHYLRLSFVPAPLVFMYDWPPAASWTAVAPQSTLLALLALLTGFAIVRRQPVGLAGAWFFLGLAPTSSVLPIATEVAAEHRMYLPLAAVVSLVVLGVYLAGRRVLATDGAERPAARRLARMGAWIGLVAAAVTLCTVARARNRDYWSNEAILSDTVRKRPNNAEARIGLGVELLERGRYGEAESQLRIALTLPGRAGSGAKPAAGAHMYLGSALCAQRKLDEGIAELKEALALNPKLSEAHGLLAEAYVSEGRFGDAAAAFDRAVSELPDLPPLLYRAAWFYATTPDRSVRNGARAVELAERGAQVTSGRDWMLLDALAAAYAEQGRFAEAVEAGRSAVAIARDTGGTSAVPELERHLARFQSGQPLQPR